MTLEILQKEMISALKSGNKFRKDVLSTLVGAVKKAGIDNQCRDNIPESLVDTVLIKEQKTMQEMIDTCPADRTELMEKYTAEMAVVKEYAPQLITDIQTIKDRMSVLIVNAGLVPDKKSKGAIMKLASAEFKGKADMKIVSQAVTEMLA